MNYRMISYILGWILIFEGLFLSVPMLTAIVYGESVLPSYLIAMGICFLIGGLLVFKKPKKKQLFAREGCVIVALSWIVLSAFGALPFLMTREIPTFIDALFETVSGFTTTGASILSDVEKLSHASLMWRSFTHWVGGMGVLVFIMAFIPLSGAQNMHIMKAESPGPSVSKLVPRVKTTALILYSIYFALTLIEFIMLLFGGMTVFEALNTAFATAGTGGFGFYNSSMGSFSPYLQIVITVFMILFAINFNCYYMLLCGKLREAFNLELRTFLIIIASVITVITINIHGMFSSVGEAPAAFSVYSSFADFDHRLFNGGLQPVAGTVASSAGYNNVHRSLRRKYRRRYQSIANNNSVQGHVEGAPDDGAAASDQEDQDGFQDY